MISISLDSTQERFMLWNLMLLKLIDVALPGNSQ
jgi:hypothetical protein